MKRKILIVVLTVISALLCLLGLAGCGFEDTPYITIWTRCTNVRVYSKNLQNLDGIPYDKEDLGYGDEEVHDLIGYEFQGVFTEAKGKGTMIFDAQGNRVPGTHYKLDPNDELCCYYTPIEYTFVFDSVGGEDCESIKVVYDSNLRTVTFPVPEKYGYEFDGWLLGSVNVTHGAKSSSSSPYLFHYRMLHTYSPSPQPAAYDVFLQQMTGENEITLKATYKPKNWRVIFDYGKEGLEYKILSVPHGDAIPEAEIPEYDTGGEIITGWQVGSAAYQGEAIEADTRLTAVWEKYHTVSFFDGESIVEEETLSESGRFTELPSPKKEGYVFAGWYDNSDLSGQRVTEVSYSDPTAYYAKWEYQTYYLSFAQVTPPVERVPFTVANEIILSDPAEREGYVFAGWYADGAYQTPISVIAAGTTKDVCVYAKWETVTSIATYEQLQQIRQNPAGNYRLTADINLNGEAWAPVAEFTGIFEGNGFKLFNFMIREQAQGNNSALFAVNRGKITGLTVSDCVVNLSFETQKVAVIGVIAGRNFGQIEDCAVTATDLRTSSKGNNDVNVVDVCVGAIAGINTNSGVVKNCTADANVTCTQAVFVYPTGIVGQLGHSAYVTVTAGVLVGGNYHTVENCTAAGVIDIDSNPTVSETNCQATCYVTVGGLIGCQYAGARTFACSSNVRIDTVISNVTNAPQSCKVKANLGGLIGNNYGAVSKCKATGAVLGASFGNELCGVFGGAIGYNAPEGTVDNCYATGRVEARGTSAVMGGFVAQNNGTVQTSYSNGVVERKDDTVRAQMGGFCGANAASGTIRNCFTASEVMLEILSLGEAMQGYSDANATYGRIAAKNEGVVVRCFMTEDTKIRKRRDPNEYYDDPSGIGEEKARSELLAEGFIKDTLLFNAEYWSFPQTSGFPVF